MNTSVVDLIKKIEQLSLRGESGEAVNARLLMEKLMKKHKITADMLNDHIVQDNYMLINDSIDQAVTLVNQIVQVYNQNNNAQVKAYYIPKQHPQSKEFKPLMGKNNVIITSNIISFLEISAMYQHYYDAYLRSLDVHYLSFCIANNLLVKSKSGQEPTQEYKELYEKAQLQSWFMDEEPFKKRLKP